MEEDQFSDRESVILSKLRGWKDLGQFCDLDVVVGPTTVQVHACILAAAIPLVQEQIRKVSSSNANSCRRYCIQLRHLSDHSETFQSIVDHVYGGPLRFTDANVGEVLKVAQILQYPSAAEECLRYMSENVTITTAFVWYRLLVKTVGRTNPTVRTLHDFIRGNFSEVVKTDEVLSLQRLNVDVNIPTDGDSLSEEGKRKMLFAVFERFLLSDSVSSSTFEQTVTMYANESFSLDWQPQPLMTNEFSHFESPVRPSPFSQSNCEKGSLYPHKSSPARQLVLDGPKESEKPIIVAESVQRSCSVALVYTGKTFVTLSVVYQHPDMRLQSTPSPTTGILMDSYSNLHFLPSMREARSSFGCTTTSDGIVVFGGYNRDGCLSSVEIYSEEKGWASLPDMLQKRGRFDGGAIDNVVYAFGGSNGSQTLDNWEEVTPDSLDSTPSNNLLPTAKSEFAVVSTNDSIYILGGCHQSVAMSSLMAFDSTRKEWSSRHPLAHVRADLAAVEHDGDIYAIGGTNYQQCLSSVEEYSISDDCWRTVSPMLYPRRGAAAVSFGNRIYVFGGYDGSAILKSVEAYCPKTNTWSECVSMSVPRCGARAVKYNGLIYIIGGYSTWGFLPSMDCFNPSTDTWTSFV